MADIKQVDAAIERILGIFDEAVKDCSAEERINRLKAANATAEKLKPTRAKSKELHQTAASSQLIQN